MAELFHSSKSNISEHISHIFTEGELHEDSVVRKFRITAADGKSYNTTFYSAGHLFSITKNRPLCANRESGEPISKERHREQRPNILIGKTT